MYFLLCTHAHKWPKPQVWVLGVTHLNTFKSGLLLLLSLSAVLHPTASKAINIFLQLLLLKRSQHVFYSVGLYLSIFLTQECAPYVNATIKTGSDKTL